MRNLPLILKEVVMWDGCSWFSIIVTSCKLMSLYNRTCWWCITSILPSEAAWCDTYNDTSCLRLYYHGNHTPNVIYLIKSSILEIQCTYGFLLKVKTFVPTRSWSQLTLVKSQFNFVGYLLENNFFLIDLCFYLLENYLGTKLLKCFVLVVFMLLSGWRLL